MLVTCFPGHGGQAAQLKGDTTQGHVQLSGTTAHVPTVQGQKRAAG